MDDKNTKVFDLGVYIQNCGDGSGRPVYFQSVELARDFDRIAGPELEGFTDAVSWLTIAIDDDGIRINGATPYSSVKEAWENELYYTPFPGEE